MLAAPPEVAPAKESLSTFIWLAMRVFQRAVSAAVKPSSEIMWKTVLIGDRAVAEVRGVREDAVGLGLVVGVELRLLGARAVGDAGGAAAGAEGDAARGAVERGRRPRGRAARAA